MYQIHWMHFTLNYLIFTTNRTNVSIYLYWCIQLYLCKYIGIHSKNTYSSVPLHFKSHRLFESYFKRSKKTLSGICTVGFEPNPSHTKRLQGNLVITSSQMMHFWCYIWQKCTMCENHKKISLYNFDLSISASPLRYSQINQFIMILDIF